MAGPFGVVSGEGPKQGRSTDLLTWTQDLLQTTLIDKGLAFYQTDWPVPKGYEYPLSLRTFTSQMVVIPGSITLVAHLRRMERATPGVMQRVDE